MHLTLQNRAEMEYNYGSEDRSSKYFSGERFEETTGRSFCDPAALCSDIANARAATVSRRGATRGAEETDHRKQCSHRGFETPRRVHGGE